MLRFLVLFPEDFLQARFRTPKPALYRPHWNPQRNGCLSVIQSFDMDQDNHIAHRFGQLPQAIFDLIPLAH